MPASPLVRLVDLAAPYWAGEAEVVRTYWNAPGRSAATDCAWLARQCFKEFWGSGVSRLDRGGVVLGTMKNLLAHASAIDVTLDRHEMLDVLDGVRAEFSHYCAFADVHDAIRPTGTPALNPERLKSWPEEDKLTALRFKHNETHGALGLRASKFTEGGYCTLFSEGMALKGRGTTEDRIAAACALVHADEFGHMLAGIAGIETEGLSEAQWRLLEELVVAQLRQRIRMRNQQFDHPVAPARAAALDRGEARPLEFDWARTGLAH